MKPTKTLLFRQVCSIRWQDMDAFNHVHHSLYFIYLQECRIEWLRAHGISMNDPTRGPIIGEISCRYLRPISYPANIVVELYFSHRSGRRIYFEQIIRSRETPELIYASAQVTVIWVDFNTGRSILPPAEYDHILALEFKHARNG